MAKKKISGIAIVGVLAAAVLGIWYFTKKKKEVTSNAQVKPNTGTAPTGRSIKPGESVAIGGQPPSGYGKM